MTRLTDLHLALAGQTAERWDPRSVDVVNAVQKARTLRAEFIADHLRRAVTGLTRWSGLAALAATLRRRWHCHRTLSALAQLDDRLLRDIGVIRADIEATAAACSSGHGASGNTVWVGLADWARREVHRRRTVSELSAMSDAMLADIGVARADIPALAAALADERQVGKMTDGTSGTAAGLVGAIPVSVQVLTFMEVRRSLRRAANGNVDQDSDQADGRQSAA